MNTDNKPIKPVRRKVLSSYMSDGYFSCTLECGHVEYALGRKTKGSYDKIAPKTVMCRGCMYQGR